MMTKIILIASILVNISQAYFKGSSAVSYQDATTYCEERGTTLASIVTENEWHDATSVCGSDDCWIGLRDVSIEGKWSWDDHSDIGTSYGFNADKSATQGITPWNTGEPNDASNSEDCVHMYGHGYYNDVSCTGWNYVPLCNDAPPSSYIKGGTASNYNDAATYCQSQGTTLASIGTESDWNDAKSVCGSDACWIGLRDEVNGNAEGEWSWDDGIDITKSYGFNTDKTATFEQGPWNTGEPNNVGDEDCVQMYPNTGKYNDARCDHSSFYPLCNKGDTPLTYGAAQTYCRSHDIATIASITTESEYNAAVSACGSNDCWVGGRDDLNGNDDMVWYWDDGSRISNSYGFNSDQSATAYVTPWQPSEPNEFNGAEEDCIELYRNGGGYNDHQCTMSFYPLCVIDSSLETITFGEIKTGTITPYNKKYYKITLTEDEPMYFETCGSGYDTAISVYDSNLNVINYCDWCNDHGAYCGLETDLTVPQQPAGTYYVGIGGWESFTGTFQLSMSQGSLSCDGPPVIGDIVSNGTDYYRIDLDSAYQRIDIEACNAQTDYDTYLYFYDANMVLLGQCDDCANHGEACISSLRGDLTRYDIEAGTYYVGIGGYGSDYGNYELTLTCEEASQPTAPTTPAPIPTTAAPVPTTPSGIDCCAKRCRKEWSTLSQTERNLYISGFKTLADQGKIQQLSAAHWDTNQVQHGNSYFLPWHRGFMMVLEDAIRGLGGEYACFALPYWDWSNEPTPAEVFANPSSLVIMNSGLGDDSNGACQNSGSPFDEDSYVPQSPGHTNGAGERCMIRNVDYARSGDCFGSCCFTTPGEIMNLFGNTPNYNSFAWQLEGNPHGAPHICISGNMGTFYSPDDPVFYLHHNFIDYIWALWQDCHDLEGIAPSSSDWGSHIFDASLSFTLSFAPYTTTTYTPADLMDLQDYDIIYDQGPLFSNVAVDSHANCPHSISTDWFNPTTPLSGARRRLRENSRNNGNRRGNGNRRKRIKFKPFRRSQQYLQELLGQPDELEIEVEVCLNGRDACPVPDYFEDCVGMSDDEVNALTIQDIISMEGLNDCQIAEREEKYSFAKAMGYLRQLCNGCLDPVCNHGIYDAKCSYEHNAATARAHSVPARYPDNIADGMNEYRGQDRAHEKYPDNDHDDFMNRYYGVDNVNNSGMNTIEISSNMLLIICALMIINSICITIYCMDNRCNISNKKRGYRVVKYDSEDVQLV